MPRLIDLTSERSLRVERDGELLRADILEKCAAAIETIGDEPAGFALVVWNKEGEMRTTYDASRGPIGPALLLAPPRASCVVLPALLCAACPPR